MALASVAANELLPPAEPELVEPPLAAELSDLLPGAVELQAVLNAAMAATVSANADRFLFMDLL
jgi:hypothetical protein